MPISFLGPVRMLKHAFDCSLAQEKGASRAIDCKAIGGRVGDKAARDGLGENAGCLNILMGAVCCGHFSGRNCGKRTTSRIEAWFVNSMTRRSMPMPSPAVGGIPYSNARRKSSSTK